MKFDFIGRKKIWFTLSAIIIIAGLCGIFLRGLNFGIDFKGGTLFDLSLKQEASTNEVRDALRALKLQKSVIQPMGKNEVLIRTRSLSKDMQKDVLGALESRWGIKEVRSVQNVGPGWGAHITEAAIIALLLSIAGLLIYISFRFEFKMAIAALTALFHDIVITLGIYALVGREINPNTVAALLTIMGYSLYDTIVVFHRVNENAPRMTKQMTYSATVNTSLNQVLARSINTSLTTLVPIVTLLLIGGETLKDFAFALVVGVTSGTYSTIFTASPILALWKESEPRYKAVRKRLERQGQ